MRSATARGTSSRTRPLRVAVAFFACNLFLCAPFIALVPAVAIKVFHEKDLGTSLLVTAQGIGAVTMGLLLGTLHQKLGTGRVLFAALTVLPLTLVGYALSPTLGIATAALLLVGFCYLGTLASFTTVAQLWAPPELRGRVVSVFMMMLGLVYPVGAIVQGTVADALGGASGVRTTIAVAAVAMFTIVVGARVLRPTLLHVLDDVPTGTDAGARRSAREAAPPPGDPAEVDPGSIRS